MAPKSGFDMCFKGAGGPNQKNVSNQEYRSLPPFYSQAQKVLDVAHGSHLDLVRAPYVLYGVKYIDPVSLALFPGAKSARRGAGVCDSCG